MLWWGCQHFLMYKNFPLSLQYIISSIFSERSSKPICWHISPHTIERSHGIDLKCWQGRTVNLSSLQPVKFSTSHKEHTLPDIQTHGLLTIDIPRKKCLFPRDYHIYLLLSHDFHGLNGERWQSLIRDISIVEIPPFKQRAKQNNKI